MLTLVALRFTWTLYESLYFCSIHDIIVPGALVGCLFTLLYEVLTPFDGLRICKSLCSYSVEKNAVPPHPRHLHN